MALPPALVLLLLAADPAATGAAPCPAPAFAKGSTVWYRGIHFPPDEVPSPTVCEAAGGEVLVMKRTKAGVEAYVCSVEKLLQGPDLERELQAEMDRQAALLPSERRDPAVSVARRHVPSCPLGGELEAKASGPPGARSLRVTCIARVSPKDWCGEPRSVPGPHGRGCLRRTCPPGLDDLEFRGSSGACIFCPAGNTDMKETLASNPELFERASGLPFVSPTGVTWLCRADAAAVCRPSPLTPPR
jgi:hypothetical protein